MNRSDETTPHTNAANPSPTSGEAHMESAPTRLRDLARAATQSEWRVIRYSHGGGRIYTGDLSGECDLIADTYSEGDREYIAACSPDVILALLDAADAATPSPGATEIIARLREAVGDESAFQWCAVNLTAAGKVHDAQALAVAAAVGACGDMIDGVGAHVTQIVLENSPDAPWSRDGEFAAALERYGKVLCEALSEGIRTKLDLSHISTRAGAVGLVVEAVREWLASKCGCSDVWEGSSGHDTECPTGIAEAKIVAAMDALSGLSEPDGGDR